MCNSTNNTFIQHVFRSTTSIYYDLYEKTLVCKLLTPGLQNQKYRTKSKNCFMSSPLLSCSPSRHGDQGFYNSLHVFFHRTANGKHFQRKRSGVRILSPWFFFHSFQNKSPDLYISRLYHLLMMSRLRLQDIKTRTQFFVRVQPQFRNERSNQWENIHDNSYILLNNQSDAALSSRIYYSLRDYSACFGCSLHPSSGVH